MSDEQLAASGNMAALDAKYRPRIFRYLLNRLHDEARAEQVTKAAFARVAERLTSFSPSRHFKSWLYNVADNLGKAAA